MTAPPAGARHRRLAETVVATTIAIMIVACPGSRPDPASGPRSAPSEPPPREASVAQAGDVGDAAPEPDGGETPLAWPSFDAIRDALFAQGERAGATEACPVGPTSDARVRCLYDLRYRGDPRAAALAYDLLTHEAVVAGVERAYTMDGGYRGMIRIEPAVPTGADRHHLEWMVAAFRDFDAFFAGLARAANGAPIRFRHRPLTLRFMRSVRARTPTAYASDWTVAVNLSGSLLRSGDAARETMFHEIFHLNDEAHGDWSPAALGATFDAIVAKCKTSIPCLRPYAPSETIVRGGTYYAFQPGNGVHEYGAELALRYYREQRDALDAAAKSRHAASFKCGPPENARAWARLKDEFFAGVDLTPACPAAH